MFIQPVGIKPAYPSMWAQSPLTANRSDAAVIFGSRNPADMVVRGPVSVSVHLQPAVAEAFKNIPQPVQILLLTLGKLGVTLKPAFSNAPTPAMQSAFHVAAKDMRAAARIVKALSPIQEAVESVYAVPAAGLPST